ncbi:MAG: hypothetical protein AAGD35_03495 [Actinomycetota bacterium]
MFRGQKTDDSHRYVVRVCMSCLEVDRNSMFGSPATASHFSWTCAQCNCPDYDLVGYSPH